MIGMELRKWNTKLELLLLTVASRQNEAIPVEPVRILGVILHHLVIQNVSHGSTPHGQTRMPGIRLLHSIDSQEPDRVDRLLQHRDVRLLQRLHRRRSSRTPILNLQVPQTRDIANALAADPRRPQPNELAQPQTLARGITSKTGLVSPSSSCNGADPRHRRHIAPQRSHCQKPWDPKIQKNMSPETQELHVAEEALQRGLSGGGGWVCELLSYYSRAGAEVGRAGPDRMTKGVKWLWMGRTDE